MQSLGSGRLAIFAKLHNSVREAQLLTLSEKAAAAPLPRTAILIGSAKLPNDERSHWRRSLRIADPFEKHIP